jgi:hypothetical protein
MTGINTLRKKRGRKWVLIPLYMLSIFLFQEALFRFSFPVAEIRNLDRAIFWNVNPNNPELQYKRNRAKYWQSSVDTSATFLHEMNLYGFRDEEWTVEKSAGKQRVLFIGDSFIEGAMAPQDQTIPQGFKNEAGDGFEVMNAGMVGQGLVVYLQTVADLIPLYKPDVAVLCIYANDLGPDEPVVPQYYLEPELYDLCKPRLFEFIHQMKNNNPILPRWTRKSQPFLPAVPLKANPWTLNEEVLKPQIKENLASEMIKGAFNPSRTNGLFIEEHYLKSIPKLGETVPFFQYVCAQNGVKPLIIYIPSRNQVTNHYLKFEKEMCLVACNDSMNLTTEAYQLHQKILGNQCSEFNVNYIDLTAEIKAKEVAKNHLYWNYDEHMRGEGYLYLGKVLWERWSNKQPTVNRTFQ